MALTSLSSLPTFYPSKTSLSSSSSSSSLPIKPFLLQFKPISSYLQFTPRRSSSQIIKNATGSVGNFYSSPGGDDDPPEAAEDGGHEVSKRQQVDRQAARSRMLEEENFEDGQDAFLAAINDAEDAPDNPENEQDSGDDIFGDIDKAISLKRKEYVKQGLLKPNPKKKNGVAPEQVIEELSPEEVDDLDEIQQLQGLTKEPNEDDDDKEEILDEEEEEVNSISPIDYDFDSYGKSKPKILEPTFKMTLAELLDESKVVPVSVYGDLEIEITGIQHDSREVCSGDLFVCCVGMKTDGHLYLSEADKRGAVAVVASKEIAVDETLGCKALVIVEDTNAVLPALAASFYGNPSKNMSVIGIAGTYGKTTTAYLIKGVYEAMALRTGMLSTIAYYVHGDNRLESPDTTLDAVLVQKLMAKMLHNGTETVVMETSSHGLALGRWDEVDFDIAVFTNLTGDHMDVHKSEEEYRDANAKLFARMVDPDRHRKIVNIDDTNAPFFIAQGNIDVPVVTFAMENKTADVHPLKFELSLFETQVLIKTPQGVLEISSGLLGKHNIYNILAAVAAGIAVGAPLMDIVRGVEEIDAVPGRCELIDEEQAFGVVVDYAHTPDGLSRLLDTVKELGPRRIITVCGCAGESDRGKRPLMAKIATEKSDVTMLTSDNPKTEDPLDILDDMLCGIGWSMQDYLKHGQNDYYPPLPNGNRIFVHDIRRVAVRAAVAMGEVGDIVVVAGKGHETYNIEGERKEYFDDREECREALQSVDELHQDGIDTSEFPWRLPESH